MAVLAAYLFAANLPHHVPDWWGPNTAFAWAAISIVALLVARTLVRRRRSDAPALRPVEVLAILAVTSMALTDLRASWTQPLRDLGLYLKAGEHFLSGAPVYMQHLMTAQPADRTDYPFLYPPFTLPVFAALARVPVPLTAAVWVAGSIGLVVAGLRVVGVPIRWALLAVIWPPLFEGLFVGNVAVPAFALFAIAPWVGAALVLGAIFKAYTGIGALWLVRERRWVELALAATTLVLLTLLTLPLTGAALWVEWVRGLRLYQESQPLVPALYGAGLPRYLPYALFIAIAVASIVLALLRGGREGLARLGVATVVASPSLFSHGFLFAVPALLTLDATWLWLGLGFMAVPFGPQLFLGMAVVAASWLLPAMRRSAGDAEALHPLGTDVEPWPSWRPYPRPARDVVPDAQPQPAPNVSRLPPAAPRRSRSAETASAAGMARPFVASDAEGETVGLRRRRTEPAD